MMRIADIHCHVLPYVDDGAQDWDESAELLKMQYEQGVRLVCCTPHLQKGMFEIPDKEILEQFGLLKEMAEKIFRGNLKVYLSREYYCDEAFLRRLEKNAVIPYGNGGYLLTEFSHRYTPDQFFEYVEKVIDHGYRPLIAHVERYPELQDIEDIEELVRMGAKIQINAGSLLKMEGRQQARWAKKLLKEGLVHVVASDAHDVQTRTPELEKAANYLEKKLGTEEAEKLLWKNQIQIMKSRRRVENGIN